MELKKINIDLPPIATYVLTELTEGSGSRSSLRSKKQSSVTVASIDMSRVQIESVREKVNVDIHNDYLMKPTPKSKSIAKKPKIVSASGSQQSQTLMSLKLESFHPTLQQAINAFSNDFVTKRRANFTKTIERPISRGPMKLSKPAVLHPLTHGKVVKFIPKTPDVTFRFDLGISMSQTAPITPSYTEENPPTVSNVQIRSPRNNFRSKSMKPTSRHPIKLELIPVKFSNQPIQLSLEPSRSPIEHINSSDSDHLQVKRANDPTHLSSRHSLSVESFSLRASTIHLSSNPSLSRRASIVIYNPVTTRKQISQLREQRIQTIQHSRKALENGSGPYLAPEDKVQYDKKLFIDLMRLRAQSYSEKLRQHLADQKRKQHAHTLEEKRLSIADFRLSDYRLSTARDAADVTNDAFAELLGISDSVDPSILSMPDALTLIMPERRAGDRREVEDSMYTSLIDYGHVVGEEEVNVDSLLFPVKPMPHREGGLGDEDGDCYWIDFEILLERQFELEKEAVSNFGRIDVKLDETLLCRFGRADVADLVWHFFKHLRDYVSPEKLFSQSVSELIQQAIVKSEGDDVKCLQSLQAVLKTLPHSQILELKSYAGHIRRIVLTSTESKAGMQQMLKRISALVSALLFETRFVVIDHSSLKSYQDALIDVNLADDELHIASGVAFEDNEELHNVWSSIKRSDVDQTLDSESALNWHSRALEFCVRFIDRLVG